MKENKTCKDCNLYDLICKDEITPLYNQKQTLKEQVVEELEKFTMFNYNTSKYIIDDYHKNLSKNRFKLRPAKVEHEYFFVSKPGLYKFSKISDLIDDKYYDELTSELRYKRCHSRSIMLCKEMQNSSVLTGYINGTHTHVLHSVLEVESFNTKYIYDWTKNIILKSKDYIDLTNYEVISRVTHDQLINDSEIIELLNLEECLKKYLLFRDEIVKDFKKKTLHL